MFSMLVYFVLALLLLVVVHEYGHFFVARCCGVKVLRFSFGFGKVLASWHDKRGTEYTWSLIPLGGYVKMLDEAEAEVPANERHMAFNNKPVLVRIAVVLAGPLFNFIFAFFALWLMMVFGTKSLIPIIDKVIPGSIAAQATLSTKQEIVSLNGHKTVGWRDVVYGMARLSGTQSPVSITVKSLSDGQQTTHFLSLATLVLDEKKDTLAAIGVIPFIPTVPPVIGEVISDSPAQIAGLQQGDVIKSVAGQNVDRWLTLVDVIKKHPDENIILQIDRQGKSFPVKVFVKRAMHEGQAQGYLGVRSQDPALLFEPWLRLQRETPLKAVSTAFKQTVDMAGATLTLVGQLVTGKLSWHSISGPVGIAQGAGESASRGLSDYLFFLALISVSLGVLNLLPIPMLDGGHLLYYLIEITLQRPVSDKMKSVGAYVGMMLLGTLMIVALHNDITRLAG